MLCRVDLVITGLGKATSKKKHFSGIAILGSTVYTTHRYEIGVIP
jgi:hypothetical protein